MPLFRVRYLDDFTSPPGKVVHTEAVIATRETVKLRARALLPVMQRVFGARDFRIVDAAGRIVPTDSVVCGKS
jgi:hypothetical protein